MARDFENIPHDFQAATEVRWLDSRSVLYDLNPALRDDKGVYHFYVVVQHGQTYETLHASNEFGEFDEDDILDLSRGCILTHRGYTVFE